MNEPSEQLIDLAFFALDHGIDSVRPGGPLTPFTVVEGDEGRELHRFVGETLEQSQEQAREHVRQSSAAVRATIARDGYLTIEGERTDAILVEAYERGATGSFVFAQRYRPAGRLKRFAAIGNAAVVDTAAPLF